MLGIFIGVAAVVSLISVGQGMQNAINEQFEQLGTNRITVQAGAVQMGPPGSSITPAKLTDHDIKVIERNVMTVLVNNQDRLMVQGKSTDVSTLKDLAKDFMAIHPDDGQHPETVLKQIDELNREMMTSKGIIFLNIKYLGLPL